MSNVVFECEVFFANSHDLRTVPWIMLGPENYIIYSFFSNVPNFIITSN